MENSLMVSTPAADTVLVQLASLMLVTPGAKVAARNVDNGAAFDTTTTGRGGHCAIGAAGKLIVTEPFQVEKEESLVAAVVNPGNPHRAADGESVIVLAVAIRRVAEGMARVQVFVYPIFIRRARQPQPDPAPPRLWCHDRSVRMRPTQLRCKKWF